MHALPVINTALGAVGAVKGIMDSNAANKRANKAAARSGKAADLELKNAEANQPFLEALRSGAMGLPAPIAAGALDEYKRAQEYDPALQDRELMGEYDKVARETFDRERHAAGVGSSSRGFGPGTSSIDRGALSDVLGRRAISRAEFKTNLLGSRTERGQAVRGNAANRLLGALGAVNPIGPSAQTGQQYSSAGGAFARNAETYNNRAASFNPSDYLGMVNDNLGKIKFPWDKGGNTGGSLARSGKKRAAG